ncbi:uncharacterized protein [Lolium perenne]|uniref:uncharacterized protein n=1 Tax=Lolium perenne TaxID=4522 RepID=UPI0021EB1CC7|nr:uncharacterized protein LOC127338028 [Lolium perenne]
MNGPVSEPEMAGILVHAKLAAKNDRAQRDRLLQFQLQLLAPSPVAGEGNDGADLPLKEIASGLLDVCYSRIEMAARSLATSFKLAVKNGMHPSLPLYFGEIPDEKLFDCLLTLRLPRRPANQFQALARVEAAYYAVKCIQEHFLPRCVEHLGYPYLAYAASDDDDSEDSLPDTGDDCKIGLPLPEPVTTKHLVETGMPDPVAVVTEDLAKIGLSDTDATATKNLAKNILPDSDAAAIEPTEDSGKIDGLPVPAPAASATGETTQAASVDLDQARTYLNRACTLAKLAAKSIDLAVTTISSFAYAKEVAAISNFVDRLSYT